MNDKTILIREPEEPAPAGQTLFDAIGGEARVRELVDRFYDLMDLDADLAELRAAHGPSLDQAREKLFWFLCGWMGGPDYYIRRFGHPRLRARHLPFSIGTTERDQWVVCMGRAMQQVGVEPALADKLLASFYNTADWMRNRPE
ncbi:hemoglobin-like protein [Pigmentiphaga sp. NML030171]|uniref:group II truncated hemoglobin n=1 Tax=unclassified Pigmentiphaga TaxID=2626614 RepID=UPI000B422B3D|nr:group II truncated hemoglobin [Pigmentiphaga sp. NML030171]OVZ58556.1 hemoglobin-like protein [Pigmentiphaga sp. NML030171]